MGECGPAVRLLVTPPHCLSHNTNKGGLCAGFKPVKAEKTQIQQTQSLIYNCKK
jgi:hypothetical protein